jgi:hypothetical protein
MTHDAVPLYLRRLLADSASERAHWADVDRCQREAEFVRELLAVPPEDRAALLADLARIAL